MERRELIARMREMAQKAAGQGKSIPMPEGLRKRRERAKAMPIKSMNEIVKRLKRDSNE